MNRYPPKEVIKLLRIESNYKCSIPDCDVPYLEYHHFSPPWSIENHHNPEGMIALCPVHHRQADGGAWNETQLNTFKMMDSDNKLVEGKFNYLRNKFLLQGGGNLFYDNIQAEIALGNHPIIWFERDENGNKMLNIVLFDSNGRIYFYIENNSWRVKDNIKDIECPPNGKKLTVLFNNGNHVKLEFKEIVSEEDLIKNIGEMYLSNLLSDIPVTLIKVSLKLTEFGIDFKPSEMLSGHNKIKGCFFGQNNIGMLL